MAVLAKFPYLRAGRALAAGAAALLLPACQKEDQAAPGPTPVQVAPVQKADMPLSSEWIGTLTGMVNANISAKVSGYLLSQDYSEGAIIKQGTVLFKLDPRQYQATLDQAKGQLAEAVARQGKTQQDVDRYTPLAAESAISQQELDNAIQDNLAAQASVLAAQANVEAAQINLDFCTITSPVTGRAGIAQAQVGDLVGPSTATPLTTVSQIDPMRVFFPVTEQQYLQYAANQAKAGRSVDDPDPRFFLRLFLADGSEYPEYGRFYVANRQVDPNTGTIMVVGLFANPNSLLRPGMYARVKAIMGVQSGALVVPQRAVSEVQGSKQVAVVEAGNKIAIRTIEVGEVTGEYVVVTKGLTAGESVVIEGTQKVAPGLEVAPTNFTPLPALPALPEPPKNLPPDAPPGTSAAVP